MSRWGRGRTLTRSYVFDIRRTSSTSSLTTCDLVSQEPLYPANDRDMVDFDTPFDQQLLHVAVRQGTARNHRTATRPQFCYIDDIHSWSTNELTINWNSSLA
jgi:hypothetical protein